MPIMLDMNFMTSDTLIRTGLEEHHLMFGATLSKWLARNLGHLKYKVGFTQKKLDWILNAFLQYQILFYKTGVHFAFGIWKGFELRKLTLVL